jgi:hypothetical protein
MGLDLGDQVTVFVAEESGRKAYSRDRVVKAFEIEIFDDASACYSFLNRTASPPPPASGVVKLSEARTIRVSVLR